MEIFVRETPQPRDEKNKGLPSRPKNRFPDRRRAGRDRRGGYDDGVIVTLSSQEERRSRHDRRQWQDPRYVEVRQEQPREATEPGTSRINAFV